MYSLKTIYDDIGFQPNEAQSAAINKTSGALFITAGPGSGKTQVLLWRTLNLIVFHDIPPEKILLTTFTEKASKQLKEGLQTLLGIASNYTGRQYDLGKMFIGTVHSICNKIIADRRFYANRQKNKPIKVMDQLEQYFFLKKHSIWNSLLEAGGINTIDINNFFQKSIPQFPNRHKAIIEVRNLFNRFSEERLNIEEALERTNKDDDLYPILLMYRKYRIILNNAEVYDICDLSLVQNKALEVLEDFDKGKYVFQHLIIDEYQDTNFIQEQLFFALAGNKNICVVGDDDQALYRFRGSTVENFVNFPNRVAKYLNIESTKIALDLNYRSKKKIVEFYTQFIVREDWSKSNRPNEQYRVYDKNIKPASNDDDCSVIYIKENWIEETAQFCKKLVENKYVKDPNQIAFLFPSVKSTAAAKTIAELRSIGLDVYAPRAGRFLEGKEASEIFGLYAIIFGLPEMIYDGFEYNKYKAWLNCARNKASSLIDSDKILKKYVADKKNELHIILKDYKSLLRVISKNGWDSNDVFDVDLMRRKLSQANNLSSKAYNALVSKYLERTIRERLADPEKSPLLLSQIINRITALDWTLLDLFYQITGFEHFKRYYDTAEKNANEGPICNLSKITEYLAKFMELYSSIITASFLNDDGLKKLFFSSYLYTLFRMEESEYEDENDPFPKGNIQVLTIHQSKGLEFPVVFLYPRRKEITDQKEYIISRFKNVSGEPLDKIPRFDLMRIFYVGMSRAESLLIIPKLEEKNSGKEIVKYINETLNEQSAKKMEEFDMNVLTISHSSDKRLVKPYSYTADYLAFERCPRQYMIYRKYGFIPSRSQTMLFGSLVHNTIEDLHQYLIAKRESL